MYIEFVDKNFSVSSLKTIETANSIIAEYRRQGFRLTLRQLYYQMVSRDYIRNNLREYKRLGNIVNDARNAGLISWDAIEDRTRTLRGNTWWDSPEAILENAAKNYMIDKWDPQEFRPEVWIEKDALLGVIEGVCRRLDVDYFSCRGYVSASEMFSAGYTRYQRRIAAGQTPVVIHLGDHDPSGIDMTRDIEERLSLYAGADIIVQRIALNYDQIEHYNPPPNFAKISDSRSSQYISEYGRSSWELDALNPTVLANLIETAVAEWRDDYLWDEKLDEENEGKERIKRLIPLLGD